MRGSHLSARASNVTAESDRVQHRVSQLEIASVQNKYRSISARFGLSRREWFAITMSYYDIDAILTDAQKVPTTFELDVPGLGYLDNAPGRPLKAGTRVELPLWLSEMLAVSSPSSIKSLVTIDLPPSLDANVLNALKADPKSVDLRAQAQHFYELGARMLELFDEELVCDVLTASWRKRAAEISDAAVQGGGNRAGGGVGTGDGVEFLRGLDESERGLFRAAHDSSKAMRNWMGEIKKN